jgi:hypothetical protein
MRKAMSKIAVSQLNRSALPVGRHKNLRLMVPLLGLFATMALADPIFISPGQCIMIGSQQVCATRSEGPAPEAKHIIHVCRYSDYKDSEIPSLKSYALIEVVINDSGRKTETITKNFGPNGREACEQELEKLNSDKK